MCVRSIIKEQDGGEIYDREEVQITLSELVSLSANFFIHGKPEHGKTTLLQQISLHLIERSIASQAILTVPILMDYSDIRSGQDRMTRALQSALLVDLDGLSLPRILEEGLATIIIDDVDLSDRKRRNLLREFVTKYPRNRYIFSGFEDVPSRINAFGEDLVVTAETPISFIHVFIKAFTRNRMRSLVEKWDRERALDREAVLNRLIGEFVHINIPVTAVNGTILLSIYESQSGFSPINRAVLIERFVEHLLEKRSFREAERRTFDFKNKVHVLSNLAAYMAQQNLYVLTRQSVVAIVRAYLDSVGLSEDPESLVEMVISTHIFARRSEERLSFRYRAFAEYFIATQMTINLEFKSWVTSKDNYLSYINEIQYYAGIVRNDSSLINEIAMRFEKISEKVINVVGWDMELTRLDGFRLPSSESTEDLFGDFERQMEAPPLSAEERDEVLEAELPHDTENRQEIFRVCSESFDS